MPNEEEVPVAIHLSPMTFIDRDATSWSVTESTFEGVPTLELNAEEDGVVHKITFYKDDAAFIKLLIGEAALK